MSKAPELKSVYKKERLSFVIFMFLSILAPGLSFIEELRPAKEELWPWFQRSGSLMVVFSLFAEIHVHKMFDIFKTYNFVDKSFYEFKEEYEPRVRVFNYVAITFVMVGTIIWGYGDVIGRVV